MNAPRSLVIALAFTAMLAGLAAACGDGGDDDDAGLSPAASGAPAQTAQPSPGTPAAGAVLTGIQQLQIPAGLSEGRTMGKSNAPVKLTMWEDFQCPFCLKYTAQVEGVIVDEFVKTGKVRLEFRQWPILGQESLNAAIASQCAAEQKKFWEYHKALFLIQAEAGQHIDEKLNVGRFTDQNLLTVAAKVGLDTDSWGSCYGAKSYLVLTQEDARAAQEAGLRGTPGFAVNGTAITAPSTLDAWRKVLNDAIANAK